VAKKSVWAIAAGRGRDVTMFITVNLDLQVHRKWGMSVKGE
jgi:hypothetical protein